MDIDDNQRVAVRPRPPVASWLSGPDTPVFVDHSGRRARGLRAAGVVLAGVCGFWLAGLVVGMAGFSGFRAGRLATGAVRAAARTGAQAEARELASAARALHVREIDAVNQTARVREVDAVNDAARSVCPSSGAGGRAGARARRNGHLTNYKAKGRPGCPTKLPVAPRRGSPRLT
jgi:hypothetical protein